MASPAIMSYTLLDTNGVKASTPLYIPFGGSLTVTQLLAAFVTAGNLLDPVTNAQIIGGQITLPCVVDGGWKTAPVEGNDVSDVVSLNFNNAVTRYVFPFLVPNILPALVAGGRVDIADADLAALIAWIGAGNASPTYAPSNSAGQDLTSLRDAFQADRKHRRQLSSTSRTIP